jgi:predicted aspartyl protease
MENDKMGKTVVKAKITNVYDLWNAESGILKPDQVRSIEVEDAVVDTGAKYLSLPKRLIQQLGLKQLVTRQATTVAGKVPCNIFEAVRLTLQDRVCTIDVAEVAEECPVLIGYFPLEILDFVVDPVNQRIIGNPEHGGEQVIELY